MCSINEFGSIMKIASTANFIQIKNDEKTFLDVKLSGAIRMHISLRIGILFCVRLKQDELLHIARFYKIARIMMFLYVTVI